MFNCKECVELLADFLDGSMSEEQERSLTEHLRACPPCVDFVRTYRATSSICRRALASQMPQELADKLTEYLRAKCNK